MTLFHISTATNNFSFINRLHQSSARSLLDALACSLTHSLPPHTLSHARHQRISANQARPTRSLRVPEDVIFFTSQQRSHTHANQSSCTPYLTTGVLRKATLIRKTLPSASLPACLLSCIRPAVLSLLRTFFVQCTVYALCALVFRSAWSERKYERMNGTDYMHVGDTHTAAALTGTGLAA